MTQHIVDARGMRCPWPALRLARVARQALPGDVISLIADDPKADGEVHSLSVARGWAIQLDREGEVSVYNLSL